MSEQPLVHKGLFDRLEQLLEQRCRAARVQGPRPNESDHRPGQKWASTADHGHGTTLQTVDDNQHLHEDLADVYLADSWVLSVETDDSHVCFVLDAVLEEGHPRFYWPPKPGEQHAYARLRWCLQGEVWWNDGPHLDRPAVDAAGELDHGNIDAWFREGDLEHLEGSWGSVAIKGARQSVEYLTS